MLKFKSLISLFLLLLSPMGMAYFDFTEVYQDNEQWRVDHFRVNAGELQELVASKSFSTRFKAMAFSNRIKQISKNKKIKFTHTEADTTPLWNVTHEWNEGWEVQYAQWVKENFKKDFFIQHNLAVDCADVAYGLRWIFSRNNGLPAAATLAGSGIIVSHLSAKDEWNALPSHSEWHKDQRFIAALNWLLDNVFTKTLYKDTYPVAVNKQTIRPGLINLLGGHTEVFSQVSYDPREVPLEILSSTMPRAIRELSSRPFLNTWPVPMEHGGLLRFRWPLKNQMWTMVPKEEMPFYSLEQYQEGLCEDEARFAFCLLKKLDLTYVPNLIVQKLQEGITNTVKQRADIVTQGLNFCQANDCSPGTTAWEDWSTPTRDGRLLSSMKEAIDTAMEIGQSESFSVWFKNGKIPVSGAVMTYFDLFQRLSSNFISNDPRDDIEMRWATNTAAIHKHIHKFIGQLQTVRDGMVLKAKPCREDETRCMKSLKLFEEHATLEIDYKLRWTLSEWVKHCSSNACPEDKALKEMFSSIWFQSPAPWDSLEERSGKIRGDGHLLLASSVNPAGERFVILDVKRLYDVKARQVVKVELSETGWIGHDAHTKTIFTVNENKFTFYDEDFNFLDEFDPGIDVLNEAHSYSLGEGIYFFGRIFDGWIINFVNKTASKKLSFKTLMVDSRNSGKFLLAGDVNLVLSMKNGKVELTPFPELPDEIGNFFSLGEDRYLVTTWTSNGTTKVFSIKGSKAEPLQGLEGSYVNVDDVNSNFFLIRIINDEEKIHLFDNNLKEYFPQDDLATGLPNGYDGYFFFRKKNNVFKGILMQGTNLKETEFSYTSEGDYIPMWTVSDDWISYTKDEKFIISDFDGRVLEEDSFRVRARCDSMSQSNTCAGKLLIEGLGISSERSPYLLMNIGKANRWRIHESQPYIIQKNEMINGGNEPFPERSLSIKTGSGIKLEDGVMLWFP